MNQAPRRNRPIFFDMYVEGVPPPVIASILQTPQAMKVQARERRRARPVGGSGATEPPDEDGDVADVHAPAAAEGVHNDLAPGPHPLPLPPAPPRAGRATAEDHGEPSHLDVVG